MYRSRHSRHSLALLAALVATGVGLGLPGHALAEGPAAKAPPTDRDTLPTLLIAGGFVPPDGFKALVVKLEPRADGAWSHKRYDWNGTSGDREDWWPASTVKLFAAIGALQTLHRHGFSLGAKATLHYEDRKPWSGRVSFLARQALVPSNNLAFDRLMELAGHDSLHQDLFRPDKGLGDTVLLRAYAPRRRYPDDNHGDPRHSPRIELVERGRRHTLPERLSKRTYACPEHGNCTTLNDLSEAIRRVMLHGVLPVSERFAIADADAKALAELLGRERSRGNGLVDGLGKACPRRGWRFAHKAGYAHRWFSDVVFVTPRRGKTRWIVAMAGYPGRAALDDAALRVGRLICEGRLP